MTNRGIGECVYCGETKETSRDHVIPRALFEQPVPKNLITVPACDSCNGDKKSTSDTILRDLLVTDFIGGQHHTAENKFSGPLIRAHRRNQSLVARNIVSNARIEPLYTSAGVYLGKYPMLKIDKSEVNNIFTWIVRSLYYDHQKKRIPDDYTFTIRRYHVWDFRQILQTLRQHNTSFRGKHTLDDVFNCAYVESPQDQFNTWWFLRFYNAVCLVVATEKAKL